MPPDHLSRSSFMEEDGSGDQHTRTPYDPQTNLRPTTGASRACDACRTRKVRCNREIPCNRCSQAGLECTVNVNRPKDKRTRLLLTPQYEKKFDQIDQRLDGITALLQDLRKDMPNNNHTGANPIETTSCRTIDEPISAFQEPHITEAHSDSTMALHSEFAKYTLQRHATVNPSLNNLDGLKDLITSLETVIESLKPSGGALYKSSFPLARPLVTRKSRGRDLPPLEVVVRLIQDPKSRNVQKYCPVFTLVGPRAFTDFCLSAYCSPTFSETSFITLNAGLFYLFEDALHRSDSESMEIYEQYVKLCRGNLHTELSDLPLYLSASSQNLSSLLCGGYYALEISEPTLAWTLIAKASEMCQTLQYQHIETPFEDADDQIKHNQLLFWLLFALDKGMSLRLNRASTISNCDISTPVPTLPPEQCQYSPVHYNLHWAVETARCQGSIYELLYSPSAIIQQEHVKHAHVQTIESQLEALVVEEGSLNSGLDWHIHKSETEQLTYLTLLCQDVTRLSLLTLTYRAVSGKATQLPSFDERCVSTARTALGRFMDFVNALKGVTIYVPPYLQSILLYAPIAFITVFCHAIESLNKSDVSILDSLQLILGQMSHRCEPITKMQGLFRTLSNLASRYIESWERNKHDGEEGYELEMNLDLEDMDYRTMNPMVWLDNLQQADDWLLNME